MTFCEKSKHSSLQLRIFWTSFSSNKPVLIGFFVDKLI